MFLVPPQASAIKSCQNLKRYQNNQKMLKPEEVPKELSIQIYSMTPLLSNSRIPVLDFEVLLKEDKLESKASSNMKRAKNHGIYSVFCSCSGHL